MKNILIVAFVIISYSVNSQEKKSYIQPGLITATTTLSPAKMLNRSDVNYYVTGFIEGRLDKHTSLRGEAGYMLGNSNDKYLQSSIRTFFGVQYGFPIHNLDLHMGFMPGMTIINSNLSVATRSEVVPSISLNAGLKFYVYKFFNFFANVSYIHTSMNNLVRVSGKADELVISAGLGFNFQVLKKNR